MPRPLSILALASPLLMIAIAILWFRSNQPVLDYVAWRGTPTTWMIQSCGSRLWLERWQHADPLPTRPNSGVHLSWTLRGTTNPPYQPNSPIEIGYSLPPLSTRGGFTWRAANSWMGMNIAHTFIALPYWSLLALSALAPLPWLAATLRRHQRRDKNRCPTCGYDLRATPARCPECGATAFGA